MKTDAPSHEAGWCADIKIVKRRAKMGLRSMAAKWCCIFIALLSFSNASEAQGRVDLGDMSSGNWERWREYNVSAQFRGTGDQVGEIQARMRTVTTEEAFQRIRDEFNAQRRYAILPPSSYSYLDYQSQAQHFLVALHGMPVLEKPSLCSPRMIVVDWILEGEILEVTGTYNVGVVLHNPLDPSPKDDGNWLQVEFRDGTVGWLFAEPQDMHGNLVRQFDRPIPRPVSDDTGTGIATLLAILLVVVVVVVVIFFASSGRSDKSPSSRSGGGSYSDSSSADDTSSDEDDDESDEESDEAAEQPARNSPKECPHCHEECDRIFQCRDCHGQFCSACSNDDLISNIMFSPQLFGPRCPFCETGQADP